MPSDPKRLQEVYRHIRIIRAGACSVIVGSNNLYRIEKRPFRDMPEASKLAILSDAVDWRGISNRDRAHILLAQIDARKVSDVTRNRLIGEATAPEPSERSAEQGRDGAEVARQGSPER